jgi:hypothetical protein
MIDSVIAQWHAFVAGDLSEGLGDLLDDEVTFYSPVVFTPQVGRAVTTAYLEAAAAVLAGDRPFRYTKQVLAGDTAVLEFETTVEGTYVNGVDIIRCNEQGRIVEFRVMIRPLRALSAVHQQMAAALEQRGSR